MATDDEIRTALDNAQQLRIDPLAVIALCDRAEIDMLVDQTPKSYQIVGKQVTFQSFEDIAKVRKYWTGKVGVIAQDGELPW